MLVIFLAGKGTCQCEIDLGSKSFNFLREGTVSLNRN